MALHWKIVIGMVVGVVFGFVMTLFEWGATFVSDWVLPIGTIFVRLLKLIAVPLILASLIKGISDLKDIAKFKDMGLRTFGLYMMTTVVAIFIGLGLVNTFNPGDGISQETIASLTETYASDSGSTAVAAGADLCLPCRRIGRGSDARDQTAQ